LRDVVWNERVKLGAAGLNSVATASVGTGFLAPLAALVYGTGAVAPSVSIRLAAHGLAQGLLGRLRG
jgi:hypothetical protein